MELVQPIATNNLQRLQIPFLQRLPFPFFVQVGWRPWPSALEEAEGLVAEVKVLQAMVQFLGKHSRKNALAFGRVAWCTSAGGHPSVRSDFCNAAVPS